MKIITAFVLLFGLNQVRAQQPQIKLTDSLLKPKNNLQFFKRNGFTLPVINIAISKIDNMPIAVIKENDNMPNKKIGGYYNMPVKKIGSEDTSPDGRFTPMLLPTFKTP